MKRILLVLAALTVVLLLRRPAPFDDGWSDITDGDWYG